MKRLPILLLVLAFSPSITRAQQGRKDEADFAKEKPAVGEKLPDLTVYSPAGKEVKLSSLRGGHVVLTFGCLT